GLLDGLLGTLGL
uniref:Caeridin-1.1/1.2/1.3 n=5 Tax=Opisthokonta TaxID=33154 RepID=CDN11_RANCH|nr:RecName: Full=Caeridin-1.1/1.2/1.3 [Litoria xanthomera]P62565.1 RecName: Full=Caeridin-1.1/1.2/1.3 [Ranoidea splendida]P62566.1 RecName: Full=Caeridin-1.1/1.2/1.3 [Ranoidea gilleni]P62567.1 RecName: Full=Caeridin-1.1/1.2/1.3 [Ranoidea chloris]prf//1911335A caeridin 1 [Ranoidea caerulea]prf//1904302D caeridin 1 [Ranoidea splendida]